MLLLVLEELFGTFKINHYLVEAPSHHKEDLRLLVPLAHWHFVPAVLVPCIQLTNHQQLLLFNVPLQNKQPHHRYLP